MSPLPSGNLPGHRGLCERANYALSRCQEAPEIDYKESSPWDEIKSKIVKTALGMSNLRDGGIIIVGVSERNDTWSITGVQDDHLSTYDLDNINAEVNKYASPPVQISAINLAFDGKSFIVIEIPEFLETPILCKKDLTGELKKGGLYCRPPGKIETKLVETELEMRGIISLASEKVAREIIERGLRVGLKPPVEGPNPFDQELEGL